MPSIILGQQRFALPVGETRIGGAGAGVVPFPQLAALQTVAVLLVTPDGAASLRSHSNGSSSLTVDGARVRATSIAVRPRSDGIDALRLHQLKTGAVCFAVAAGWGDARRRARQLVCA